MKDKPMGSKKYMTTKEDCQSRIDLVVDGVCPGCGGKVTPLETVDNSDNPTFWAGCEHCSVFTYPVKENVYRTAQTLLDENEYVYHSKPYQVSDEELEYWRETESRALCDKIRHYIKVYNEVSHA